MNPERAHTVFLLRFKGEPLRKVSTAFLLINPRHCWYLPHGRLLLFLGHQMLFHMNLSSPRCTFFSDMTLKEAISGMLGYFRSCCYCRDSRSSLPKKLPSDSNLGGGMYSQTPSLPIPLSVPHMRPGRTCCLFEENTGLFLRLQEPLGTECLIFCYLILL